MIEQGERDFCGIFGARHDNARPGEV